jgi:hypothetical protein
LTDYLLVTFNARQNGELVTARAILGQDLVAASERGVVEQAIESGDSLRTNQANALNV